MRSYTNKDGEQITVSQEHLETAIRIKKELQKASASRRASWNQLVRLMEIEGFYDSENSEAYRCMIKAYQKSVGELPELPKHADMVADNKLKSIKSLVGEIAYEKRENQHYLKEINKGKRELIDFAILVEEIGNAIREHDFSEVEMGMQPLLPSGEKKMIVGLSDLHVGALVDTDINKYNFNIAVERLSKYASRIIREARDNDISDLYIMNLGDTVEHASMRFSQGFNAEFTFSEQIVRASDLIIKFLMFLAREGFNITYAGIAGNHDRITDKDKNIDGDHAVKPINEIIKVFINHAGISNIKFEEAKDYGHNVELNTRNFKFVHGDLDSLKDDNLVAKHSSIDGIDYDMIVMGHYHHFREMEVGYDKRVVTFGSLKGADEYGERIRKISVASQGLIIVDENGEIDVKRVKLA
jgi:predicted phosphodiesterase